ncbi:uncharacterized protein EKO05_0002796 [Ascochyta rabiei]|uniref:Uncharacterized protein n=1 Tax=Didymella rabiei TaxID=5454 RepID=A0A163EG10_DIDRA|nr:uncharacterized protein EKO05_0002796 [Ascochyta rabiei]KZM20139.1 hypothetical protein ST47_g8703 [Ascochyta rabiei]KZM23677.1 hypothetical protein ST47_g5188 [Ascochyta rabiei]UPX12239.1 hypothetical protein EKO05_0002796 [Ascochyta rabiei]
MADTPPFALNTLKADFELSDAQFDALPPLSEVDLVRQTDSHLIEHATLTTAAYHPFKLFIGESNMDAFHVYLYRTTGSKRQYRMEITSVDLENGSHYDPIDATYYGTIGNLAYPFNTFLGGARFVAVVKWYFTVGLRTGLFDEDSGFALSSSWRRDLQGACNELLAATDMEERTKQQAEAIRIENKGHVREKHQKESLEAANRTAGSRRAKGKTGSITAEARKHPQNFLPHQESESIKGYDGPKDAEDPGSGQSSVVEPSPMPPVVKSRGDRRREDQGATQTIRSISRGIAASNEDLRRRAQGIREAQGSRLDAVDGRALDYNVGQNVNAEESRLQDTKRRMAIYESPDRDGLLEYGTTDVEAEAVSLEAEYTMLFRRREKTNHRMRAIQNEMSVVEFQALLEKIVDGKS